MNLPQNATDFLDAFIGLARRTSKGGASPGPAAASPIPLFTVDNLPRIHVYAFSTAADPIAGTPTAHHVTLLLASCVMSCISCDLISYHTRTTPHHTP